MRASLVSFGSDQRSRRESARIVSTWCPEREGDSTIRCVALRLTETPRSLPYFNETDIVKLDLRHAVVQGDRSGRAECRAGWQ